MKRISSIVAALAALLVGAVPGVAEDAGAPTPNEIVAAAPAADWTAIAPSDLLVMELARDAAGKPRQVVIQLLPPPFSQAWIGNMRKLAAAHWWDGTSINRVQDDYVVQWGDAQGEDKANAKPLPSGLVGVSQDAYSWQPDRKWKTEIGDLASFTSAGLAPKPADHDSYVRDRLVWTHGGWPFATDFKRVWPIHCYGTVGVGRDLPPDTGTGAELYAVIGQAPRQLDRNIAVVGRVIDGIEQLSSLPRGTGPLGFYEAAAERVPIVSVRVGDTVPGLPAYEYLSTESPSFARYADARANRRDPFYIAPAGGADICNIPVPVRRVRQG